MRWWSHTPTLMSTASYERFKSLVDFDGFYLESQPCLVFYDPEVPYSVREDHGVCVCVCVCGKDHQV